MNSEWLHISARLEETTAMLGATNLALTALASLLPKDQFEELMNRIARDSAVKQSFVEQSGTPAPEVKVRLMQEAEERVAATLRKAHAYHAPR
jgi:4-aminobutyrate aminotransferase-like enzyme